jgi:hypothetical protein
MSYIKGFEDGEASLISKLSSEVQQQVEVFIRQLLQQVHVSSLSWPVIEALLDPHVQDVLCIEIFEPENLKYPFPVSYELRVLKTLIARIESNIRDPDEEVWSMPCVAFHLD